MNNGNQSSNYQIAARSEHLFEYMSQVHTVKKQNKSKTKTGPGGRGKTAYGPGGPGHMGPTITAPLKLTQLQAISAGWQCHNIYF